jgi:hypothetical protein
MIIDKNSKTTKLKNDRNKDDKNNKNGMIIGKNKKIRK